MENTKREKSRASKKAERPAFNLMKRHNNLFNKIVTMDNLRLAFCKASKGKHDYRQVIEVERDLDNKLFEIQRMLLEGTFSTSAYKIRKIYEPKERIIYVLPFFPDRIVQHAIMNIVAPIWDSMFIYDSFSCRKNKGQHAASNRIMQFIGGKDDLYCLHCDISKFFPSINHDIMMKLIVHKIKDKRVLLLLKDIVYSIKGGVNAPIGNLTSQWLGNLYMHKVDLWIKQTYHIKKYVRYCDDFIIIHKDKKLLQHIRKELPVFLRENLKLHLSKCTLYPVNEIDFIGYRHFINRYILIRKRTKRRMKRTIQSLKCHGANNPEAIKSSIDGWLVHANSYNLRRVMYEGSSKDT